MRLKRERGTRSYGTLFNRHQLGALGSREPLKDFKPGWLCAGWVRGG